MAAKKKPSRPAHKSPAKAPEQSEKGGKKTYDNTNRGALFVNDKDGNESRPDYTGILDVEIPEKVAAGEVVKFRLAGWVKESKSSGEEFVSLVVSVAGDKSGEAKGFKKGK